MLPQKNSIVNAKDLLNHPEEIQSEKSNILVQQSSEQQVVLPTKMKFSYLTDHLATIFFQITESGSSKDTQMMRALDEVNKKNLSKFCLE